MLAELFAEAVTTGWIFSGVATIIATLASVVAFLYKSNAANNEKHISNLESDVEKLKVEATECRRDREGLRVEVASLKAQLELHIRKTEAQNARM